MARFKLKLKRLDWISPVDTPAQETARVLLLKRNRVDGFARAVKFSDELGLVFCWAFTSKRDGEDYYDLQQDAIDEDFVKAAAEFMENGGGTDEMHDGISDGRVVFAMPLTPEIAAAYGVTSKTTGLMVALKPSAEVYEKFKTGEYTGVSIEGLGERTKVASATKCQKCSSYMEKDATACSKCGYEKDADGDDDGDAPDAKTSRYSETDGQIICTKLGKRAAIHYVGKSTWSTATVDDLPDSSFLYIEGGGTKDSGGKTTPRSLRHFPYKDENGKVDLPHLRDAIGRIPQSSLPATLRNKLQAKAEKLLGKQHEDGAKRYTKAARLTTAVAGHVHLLDDGGDAPSGETDYRSMPGAENGGYHSHPWVRATDGTIVIGEAENHDHVVLDVDATDGDDDEDDASAGKRAANSTPLGVLNHADITSKENAVDELKKQLAEAVAKLNAATQRNESIAKMSIAHRSHWATLDGAAADAFLAKSDSERDALVSDIEKRNEVVYTDTDGQTYRKSDDPRFVAMAKSRDEERKARLDADVSKRAESMCKGYPGTVDVHTAAVKAIDGIKDDKVRAEVVKMIDAGRNALARLFSATDYRLREGFELPANGSDTANGAATDAPDSDLRKYVEKYQADNKIPTYQQALVKALAEDEKAGELYAAAKN